MKQLVLFILVLSTFFLFGQDYPRHQFEDLDSFVDDLFQQQDEGVNYEMLYENLVNYNQTLSI